MAGLNQEKNVKMKTTANQRMEQDHAVDTLLLKMRLQRGYAIVTTRF